MPFTETIAARVTDGNDAGLFYFGLNGYAPYGVIGRIPQID
jgi:hypothetical protein